MRAGIGLFAAGSRCDATGGGELLVVVVRRSNSSRKHSDRRSRSEAILPWRQGGATRVFAGRSSCRTQRPCPSQPVVALFVSWAKAATAELLLRDAVLLAQVVDQPSLLASAGAGREAAIGMGVSTDL